MSAAPEFFASFELQVDAEATAAALEQAGCTASISRVEQRARGDLVSVHWELYVPGEQLERAREALAVAPVMREQLPGVFDARGGATVCEVHDVPLRLPCERCGTFVCPQCVGSGAVLCDACEAQTFEAQRAKRDAKGTVGTVVLAVLALSLLGLILWSRFS